MPIDDGAVAARITDITAGPGGIMTDEVGVITGDLTLCTILLTPAAGADGAPITGYDLELRAEYRGAAEWYVVTGSRTRLCGEPDLDNVHRLAVGLLDRPDG